MSFHILQMQIINIQCVMRLVEEKGKTFCRCRKEIEEVIGGRRASMSDVFAMPYLQATIAEVFLFLK